MDQSRDGRTTLLSSMVDDGVATAVDTVSGATRTVRLPHPAAAVLLLPDGSGLLEVGYAAEGSFREPLYRVDRDGSAVTVPSTVRGRVALTGGGRLVVPGSGRLRRTTLRVLDLATGRPLATYAPATGTTSRSGPAAAARSCSPARRAARTRRSTSCTRAPAAPRRSAARTNNYVHAFVGDLDARRLRSGTFVEEAGPCGVVYVTKQASDGTMREIRPPHAVGNILLVGAQHGCRSSSTTWTATGPTRDRSSRRTTRRPARSTRSPRCPLAGSC